MLMLTDHFTLSTPAWRVQHKDIGDRIQAVIEQRKPPVHRPFRLRRLWKALAAEAKLEKPGR